MRILTIPFLSVVFAAAVSADPRDLMADVCDLRARNESGYSGATGTEFGTGRTRLRISGSAAVGVSRSSVPGDTYPSHGRYDDLPAGNRQGRRAAQTYRRVFGACMGRD